MVSGDPLRDFDAWEDEREARMEQLPTCEHCHEHILEEHLWDIDGEIYCEECAKDIIIEKFRKRTEEYMED